MSRHFVVLDWSPISGLTVLRSYTSVAYVRKHSIKNKTLKHMKDYIQVHKHVIFGVHIFTNFSPPQVHYATFSTLIDTFLLVTLFSLFTIAFLFTTKIPSTYPI